MKNKFLKISIVALVSILFSGVLTPITEVYARSSKSDSDVIILRDGGKPVKIGSTTLTTSKKTVKKSNQKKSNKKKGNQKKSNKKKSNQKKSNKKKSNRKKSTKEFVNAKVNLMLVGNNNNNNDNNNDNDNDFPGWGGFGGGTHIGNGGSTGTVVSNGSTTNGSVASGTTIGMGTTAQNAQNLGHNQLNSTTKPLLNQNNLIKTPAGLKTGASIGKQTVNYSNSKKKKSSSKQIETKDSTVQKAAATVRIVKVVSSTLNAKFSNGKLHIGESLVSPQKTPGAVVSHIKIVPVNGKGKTVAMTIGFKKLVHVGHKSKSVSIQPGTYRIMCTSVVTAVGANIPGVSSMTTKTIQIK